MSISIAIDGPAGAGKSTIAKRISKLRNLVYLDTGAMYRACALKAIRMGISCTEPEPVNEMMGSTEISIKYENEMQQIYLDGENVTSLIRTPEVSKGASDISAIQSVRLKMVDLQRAIAKGTDVILDGRDIGTYVLPDADVKIFLNATPDERAGRRLLELREKGDAKSTFEDVKKDIEYRDYNDSNRAFAPLKKAEDAIEVDTTFKSIDEVVEEIVAIIDTKCSD